MKLHARLGVAGVITFCYFAVCSCLVLACLSNVARGLAPGIWGYLAAVAVLAATAPMPALLISRGVGHFLSQYAAFMFISAAAGFLAIFAGAAHWPAWAAICVVGAAAALARVITRAVRDEYIHHCWSTRHGSDL